MACTRRGTMLDTPAFKAVLDHVTTKTAQLKLSGTPVYRQDKLPRLPEPRYTPAKVQKGPTRKIPKGSLLSAKPKRGKALNNKSQDIIKNLDFSADKFDHPQYRVVFPKNKVLVDKRVPTVRKFLRRQENSDDWYGKGLACYTCLNLKPYNEFADAQIHGARGPTGPDQHLRFCIPCGVRYGNYSPGSLIRAGDKTCAVCRGCHRAHTVWCAHCALCTGCRRGAFASSCSEEDACLQDGRIEEL